MKKKIEILTFAILLAFLICGIANSENIGFVTTQSRYLLLNGNNFYFNGVNQYYLPFKPQAMVDEILQDASQIGINVIRTWGFADGVGSDGIILQPQPGVYDENAFRKLDYVIYAAGLLNIRLIIPLVNNWDDFGGMNKYVEWSSTANVHDDFYIDPQCKDTYKSYLSYVLNRVNTYSGIAYKDDPTIMIWELANEPRCESDTTGARLYNWIEEMASFIKAIDHNHLVATGEEGWYANKGTDWKYNGSKGADFLRNSQSQFIDICSFHLYPQTYSLSSSDTLTWINEHIDDAHNLIKKPVYVGEFGWRAPREIIGDFSQGTETWKVDWGYGQSYPLRIETPSQNSNGSIVYLPDNLLSAFQEAAGERWLDYPGFDFNSYDIVSGWVFIPASAPTGMQAQIYTKSGNDWIWREGDLASLIPGQWTRLTFSALSAFQPNMIKSVGIRIRNGSTDYAGPIYYDSIVASSTAAGSTISDRDAAYASWFNSLDARDADGAVVWLLSGHRTDSAFVPDYDEYSIYYPEDAGTCNVIKNYSVIVANKNSGVVDNYPSVSINAPLDGQTVSGTVLIRATATDDKGIAALTYSIDGGTATAMTDMGNNTYEAYWNSTGVANGNHTITVQATDTASQSTTAQSQVSVNNIVQLKTYVKKIDLSLVRKGGRIQAVANIYVVDNAGQAVSSAVVYTHWSGLTSDSDITGTDRTGAAKSIKSDTARAASGTFRITVDNITKAGYVYTPALNLETSDEISF